jgi:biotin operon repressor
MYLNQECNLIAVWYKYSSQHKRTGTPKSLAQKLDLSVRTLQRMVHQLREMGCPFVRQGQRFLRGEGGIKIFIKNATATSWRRGFIILMLGPSINHSNYINQSYKR